MKGHTYFSVSEMMTEELKAMNENYEFEKRSRLQAETKAHEVNKHD